MPGYVSVQASSAAWPTIANAWSTGLNESWIPDYSGIGSTGALTANGSPTSSGYIFTSSGDGTTGSGNGLYALGRPVRILQGSTTFFGNVASASVAAGVTTVGLSSASMTPTAGLSTGVAFTSVAAGVLAAEFHCVPNQTDAYDLGSTSLRFRDVRVGRYLYVGSTDSRPLPTYGLIRVPNSSSVAPFVVARNNADSANVDILALSGSNVLWIGGGYAGNAASIQMNDATVMRTLQTANADATGHLSANARVWVTGST